MNKIPSTTAKNSIKNLLSLSEFKSYRNKTSPVLTVEINKQPSVLLTNSLWVGYRNGGMASWLSSLMPHLPHQKFCLYMDEDSYQGSQYMFSYYSEYFEKLFHNQYIGTFIHPRRLVNQKELSSLNDIKAKDLQNKLMNKKRDRLTVFLDLRGSDAATKCQMNKIVHSYQNCQYINVPLNDDELIDTLQMKTNHLENGTQIITLCQKGYRSLIGYSFLNLVRKHKWDIQLCRDPINQIKQQLSKPTSSKVKLSSFGMGYKSGSPLVFV